MARIRFDVAHFGKIRSHPSVEEFYVQPTSDGMEFEFIFKRSSALGANIDPHSEMTFVEFTNCSYDIYWADREKGNQRIRFEAREFAALDHVNDVIMNIVDFLEIVVEHHSGREQSVNGVCNPFALRALAQFYKLIKLPKTYPDRWDRKMENFNRQMARYRRLDEYK
jgi:hypothetical protein